MRACGRQPSSVAAVVGASTSAIAMIPGGGTAGLRRRLARKSLPGRDASVLFGQLLPCGSGAISASSGVDQHALYK